MTLEDLIQRLALKPDDGELRRLMAYELARSGYGPMVDGVRMAEQINAMHAAMLAKMEARARHSREMEMQRSRRNVSGVSNDEIAAVLERYRRRINGRPSLPLGGDPITAQTLSEVRSHDPPTDADTMQIDGDPISARKIREVYGE